ncbi:hypothetical protein [Ruegeria arenilitoris]|uniref:hypothetical protein n=1 Tax=Ruegeria arenilitoris TaxID=1173585 RepID=UPI00147C6818|nr:hypothetical protein [Ruegeria arenilitoris]
MKRIGLIGTLVLLPLGGVSARAADVPEGFVFGYCLEFIEYVDQLVALTERNSLVLKPEIGGVSQRRLEMQSVVQEFERFASLDQQRLLYDEQLSLFSFERQAEDCEFGIRQCDPVKMSAEALLFFEKAASLCATKS